MAGVPASPSLAAARSIIASAAAFPSPEAPRPVTGPAGHQADLFTPPTQGADRARSDARVVHTWLTNPSVSPRQDLTR